MAEGSESRSPLDEPSVLAKAERTMDGYRAERAFRARWVRSSHRAGSLCRNRRRGAGTGPGGGAFARHRPRLRRVSRNWTAVAARGARSLDRNPGRIAKSIFYGMAVSSCRLPDGSSDRGFGDSGAQASVAATAAIQTRDGRRLSVRNPDRRRRGAGAPSRGFIDRGRNGSRVRRRCRLRPCDRQDRRLPPPPQGGCRGRQCVDHGPVADRGAAQHGDRRARRHRRRRRPRRGSTGAGRRGCAARISAVA